MDVERIIDDIEQLQEMFEAPDIRPLSASDISAANRRHDEMLAHNSRFRIEQNESVPDSSSHGTLSEQPSPKGLPTGRAEVGALLGYRRHSRRGRVRVPARGVFRA